MAEVIYTVCKAAQTITNTEDRCQGVDSPRWTPSFGEVCKTVMHCYAEGEGTVWGPSLTNEFQVIKDDLVTKYGSADTRICGGSPAMKSWGGDEPEPAQTKSTPKSTPKVEEPEVEEPEEEEDK